MIIELRIQVNLIFKYISRSPNKCVKLTRANFLVEGIPAYKAYYMLK